MDTGKSSSDIRQSFLEYFNKQGCRIVPSDSLIPSGDPTLLFTSAGMVQFKKHFLGQSKDTFTRATTCQKCFRTSDIDQVGVTNRHLTFFEMLGNFSFGDYFKKEAIAWGWDFLTGVMALPKDKLYVTIYKDDDEAGEIWKKIVPSGRIIRMGEETNFWNMGPTGPCGPCSEILLDLGPEMSCGKPDCGPACSCNRHLEIWNLVFTQFDRQADGTLRPLPRKNIDTGMGLERLVAAVNGKKNVFETDLFTPTIEAISDALNVPVRDNLPKLRMMADHCRAITFLISDGILPSNEGRGYVLRRILRRALRQAKLYGAKEPFLYRMVPVVAGIMKQAYPDLMERRESIASIARMEEEKFLETLESGTKILEDVIERYRSAGTVKGGGGLASKFVIPGNEVFRLYDTYGFPPDLTREIVKEQGLEIDEPGFAAAQKEAQEKSRAAWSGSGEKDMTFYATLNKKYGNTAFTGYETMYGTATVLAIIRDNAAADALKEGDTGEVILDKTPFYAESGGQSADTGTIDAGPFKAEVSGVQKPVGGMFVHTVKVIRGELKAGMTVTAAIDVERRRAIMRHHTATHLLHKALRQILGTHVTQAGSLVTPDYFRFDFTHLAGMKQEELDAAEEMVNAAVRGNLPVCIKEMSIDEARKAGAMALFGEKYGEKVRTVTVREDESRPPYSMELCGGTHVSRTGDIGMFKILSESSVAAGTRRIEAVTGAAAEKYVAGLERLISDIALKMKSARSDLLTHIDRYIAQDKEKDREIQKLKTQLAQGGTADLTKNIVEIDGVKLLSGKVADVDAGSLREVADNLKVKMGSGIVLLASVERDKLSFIVCLTKDVAEKGFNAGKIAKTFAGIIGGSGGGKPDFAQGGGKDASKVDEALDKIKTQLK